MRAAHMALLDAAEDEMARRVLAALVEIDGALLHELMDAGGVLTEARAAEIVAAMRRVAADELEALIAALPEYTQDVLVGAMRSPESYAKALAASPSKSLPDYRALAATLRAVHDPDRMRQIIAGPLDSASRLIIERYEAAIGAVGRKMAAAAVQGQHSSDVAAALADEAFTLNVGALGAGEINDEAFARMLSRTVIAESDNAVARAEGESLGLTLWVNIGVPDAAQSEECEAASNAGAMTRAEWAASYGEAPRHPNCRCELIAISEESADDPAWKQGPARRE
jgi:hypothetical protein